MLALETYGFEVTETIGDGYFVNTAYFGIIITKPIFSHREYWTTLIKILDKYAVIGENKFRKWQLKFLTWHFCEKFLPLLLGLSMNFKRIFCNALGFLHVRAVTR